MALYKFRIIIIIIIITTFHNLDFLGRHFQNYLPTDLRQPNLSYSRFRQSLNYIVISSVAPKRSVNALTAVLNDNRRDVHGSIEDEIPVFQDDVLFAIRWKRAIAVVGIDTNETAGFRCLAEVMPIACVGQSLTDQFHSKQSA